MNIVKKHRSYFLFILVVSLAALLRFYQLNDIYVFNLDEEYQATYSWKQVLDLHPIWIGLPAAAIEFYLGPYLTYFTAILLFFSKGDPIILAYFAAFLGVITTATIFFVGRFVFNLTTAFIASSLYASLPVFVFFDQKYWNTMFTPLIAVLLFLSLNLIRHSKWWWVLIAGLIGAIFEAHLLPIPLILIVVWFFLGGKYWKDIKLVIVCVLVFLVFYWPLIIFDLNHNFSNLKVIGRIFQGGIQSDSTLNPQAKYGTLFDSLGRFWYLKAGNPNADEVNFGCSSLSLSNGYQQIDKYTSRTYSPFWLSLISFVILILFLAWSIRKKNFSHKLLAIFLIVSVLFFLIYSGGAYEYYLLVFLTLFTFVPGFLISKCNKNLKLVFLGFVMIVVYLGIYTVFLASDEFSLGPKKALISKVMKQVGDESFSIDGRGICHNYEGWRYLFKAYGRTPNQSYTDNGLGWLYPDEISKIPPTYTIILSEDRIPLNEDLSKYPSIKEGGYRAYIKKN